jgi:transposase-like protein
MARVADVAKWEAWKQRLKEFERGDWSVGEFCRRVGVSPATFYQWKRKLGQGRTRSEAGSRSAVSALNFVPIEITGRPSIEVQLANGARVLVPAHDAEAIRTVIGVLVNDRTEGGSC